MFRKRHPPRGARPGTLVPLGNGQPTVVRALHYNKELVREFEVRSLKDLHPPSEGVLWVDVQGLRDEPTLRRIAETFGIHPLALEDVVNTPQRPKLEEHDDYLFLITRTFSRQKNELRFEQVSLLFGARWVLTFQELAGDDWDPIRKRTHNPEGRMRSHQADYLAYALLDAVIDGYFPFLEEIGVELEQLEIKVTRSPEQRLDARMHQLKRDLLCLRRSLGPQTEAFNQLLRSDCKLIDPTVRVYLRDCHDHCMQCLDEVDSFREVTTELISAHMMALSNRTNDVMKVLTLISSIFIPLSFVAGVYGMNFLHMPELDSPLGYPLVLCLMALVAAAMVYYFVRKGWMHWPRRRS